jgi:hypothetical protein
MSSRCRPEQTIQRAVFEHLCWRGFAGTFAFHVPLGGARSGIEAAIMKGLGVVAGVPDILIIHDGHVYALELKAPGGRLTPTQRDAHARLRAAGAQVATATGLNEALHQLEAWKLLKTETKKFTQKRECPAGGSAGHYDPKGLDP